MLRDVPQHALNLAAKNAFWKMGRQDVAKYAKLMNITVSPGTTLFGALMEAVEGILKCSHERAVAIVSQRMAASQRDELFAENFLQMDEAIELIDKNDREVVAQEQKKAEDAKEEAMLFRKEFELARQRVGQPKKRQKADNRPPLPHTTDQATARVWVPPTCHIWLSNVKPEWWGHCHPYVRVRSKYNTPEEEGPAVARTIKLLWEPYLEREGKAVEDCPYDIF